MKLMSVLWNELKVCKILLNHRILNSPSSKRIKSVCQHQQKRAQKKSRAISPIPPEDPSGLLNDIETEYFLAVSSNVIYEEAPLDEERPHTPILDGAGSGVAGSSKVPDMTGGQVGHSQKSKNPEDDHSDDQLGVSQEKPPPKIADLEPITEPEDSGEGKSNSAKKFKPTATLLLKSNKGTCVGSIIVGC